MEDIISKNSECIQRRIQDGINLVKENFELVEIPVKEELDNFLINGSNYKVHQYEVVGLGNLTTMESTNNPNLMMDTFLITPYYKQMPLFTTDYMYMGEKRGLLNEVYNLVDEEFITDEYNKFIQEFKENCSKYNNIADMPVKPCWYDEIRPVCAGKAPTPEQDEDTYNLFMDNLKTFLKMANCFPTISTKEDYDKKWNQNKQYSDNLVNSGGVSTDVVANALGKDHVLEFYDTIFFAPAIYKNKFNI